MIGFILLHRNLLDWEWYKDANTKLLFIHCLLKSNWEDKKWQGIEIKRGSFITSINGLSIETGLSEQNVRTSLKKLISTGELTSQSTNKNTLLTIVKYGDYQQENIKPNKQVNKRSTNEQQTANIPLTTTKEYNNTNKENKEVIYISFDHLKITFEDHQKLQSEYTDIQISEVYTSIQNYKKNTSYKSLYLTAKKWLSKEPKKPIAGTFIKPPMVY